MGADDRRGVEDLLSVEPRKSSADGRSIVMGDPEETTTWERARERGITDEQWARFEDAVAEMFGAFGMDLDTEATEATPRRFVRALFEATAGYEGDPKLLTAFPTECRGGPDCSISQVIEGPSVLLSVRAPRVPVLRRCARRLRGPRADHRHLQDDPARSRVRTALHGAGACRPADRRPPERDDAAARRGGASPGCSPLHPDARCARGAVPDVDLVLARELRARPGDASRVPHGRAAIA